MSQPNIRKKITATTAPRPSVCHICEVDSPAELGGNGEGVGCGEGVSVAVPVGTFVGADLSVGVGTDVWVGV